VGGIGSNGQVVALPDFRYKLSQPAPPAPGLHKQSRSANSSPAPSFVATNGVGSSSSTSMKALGGRSRIARATFDSRASSCSSMAGRSPVPSPRGGGGQSPGFSDRQYAGIASPDRHYDGQSSGGGHSTAGQWSPQREQQQTDFARAVGASNTAPGLFNC
jgi:hypothetical protein